MKSSSSYTPWLILIWLRLRWYESWLILIWLRLRWYESWLWMWILIIKPATTNCSNSARPELLILHRSKQEQVNYTKTNTCMHFIHFTSTRFWFLPISLTETNPSSSQTLGAALQSRSTAFGYHFSTHACLWFPLFSDNRLFGSVECWWMDLFVGCRYFIQSTGALFDLS